MDKDGYHGYDKTAEDEEFNRMEREADMRRKAVSAALNEHAMAQRKWKELEPSDMPDGDDPMYDHPHFIAGMVYANNVLKEKNA